MEKQNTSISWTPEMDAAMQKLAADGLSGTKIAEALTNQFNLPNPITRNSVIGRANRIKLKMDKKPVVRKKKSDDNPKGADIMVKISRFAPPPAIKDERRIKGLRLHDLGSCQCRWTDGIGHPSQFTFCGAKTKPGSSYCEEHYSRVYLKTPKKY